MATAHAQPIRVALLGVDDATPALVRAIAEHPQFELVGACELADSRHAEVLAALAAPLGRLRRFQGWESLLDRELVDVVFAARAADDDRRAEHLRKLIQTGIAVLASHPVVDSMLVYYELDMIRRDTQSAIVPYLPERHHPAVRALSAMLAQGADSPIGKVEQVVFARCIARQEKESVLTRFARDVDVLRAIAGDMTRLGAMAGTREPGSYAGLGVQMSGPSGVLARWTVDPMQAVHGAQLTVLGTQGKATVEIAAGTEPWTMEVTTGGKSDVRSFDPWSPGAAALDQLVAALAGRPTEADWVDASRAIELAETIDRSLAKGRTIELYYEDYTEEGTFKGTMTSVGCGLLVLGLCMLGLVAMADHLGVPYMRAWPYVLAGGLGVFLLLQLLMLVFGQRDDRPADASLPAATESPLP